MKTCYLRMGSFNFQVPDKKKGYSPHQKTGNAGEYALARLDDLMNWGRKVGEIIF